MMNLLNAIVCAFFCALLGLELAGILIFKLMDTSGKEESNLPKAGNSSKIPLSSTSPDSSTSGPISGPNSGARSIDEHPLCLKLASPTWDHLSLLSLSPLSPSTLAIYESDQLYLGTFLPKGPPGLALSPTSLNWTQSMSHLLKDLEPNDPVCSLSQITATKTLNLVTVHCEFIWQKAALEGKGEPDFSSCGLWGRTHQTYALLLNLTAWGSTQIGYAINRDLYTRTFYFTIYDLHQDPASHQLSLQTFNSESRDGMAHIDVQLTDSQPNLTVYYLEKTSDPGQLLLVHNSTRAGRPSGNPASQLLTSLPRGFISPVDGRLHLFDLTLGCVYVISGMPESLFQAFHHSAEDILVRRVNVPFERYFGCPEKVLQSQSNRCDTTNSWPMFTF